MMLLWLGCSSGVVSAVDGLVDALPPSSRVVSRVDGGWPVVLVVEQADGDPRVGEGDETVLALRRFAALVADPDASLAGLRDLVLAGVAPPRAVESYAALRTESFERIAAYRHAGTRIAVEALRERGTVVLEVPGVRASDVAARLVSGGATVLVVRPAELADLPDPALWWAGLEAALPPVLPSEDGLPSFDGWIAALQPHAAAVAAWDGADAVRATIRAASEPPMALAADDPLRPVLEAAARQTGAPELRWAGGSRAGTPMSYDPLYDVLRVDAGVAGLPPDLVAAVLVHESTHVRDLRRAAAALGTDPAGWALLHDTLPPGVMRGISLLAEDRAFRAELASLETARTWLPEPRAAERTLRDPAATGAERLRATLAVLEDAGPGTFRWAREIGRMVPVPE